MNSKVSGPHIPRGQLQLRFHYRDYSTWQRGEQVLGEQGVGELGVGEQVLGEQGVGDLGVGELGVGE